MKKILTLMVMFAMTAGILSTQAQTLSYQVVVRDVNNNLVVNQDLNVHVQIYSPETDGYSQDIPAKTNLNGMLSLIIGQDLHGDMPVDNPEAASFSNIDWEHAVIQLNFNYNGHDYEVKDTVFAVPYAMQASFLLTTQQIVDYIGDVQVNADINDWARIYNALRANEPFFNAIRDTVVNYVKANYPIAKQIAFHYLSQMTAADVNEAYDTIDKVLTNQEIADALNVVIMDYVQKHRSLAYEVARYYAQHANPEGLQKVYNAAMTREDVVNPIMDSVLLVFLKEFGLDPACMTDYNYDFCGLLDAAANLGDMGTCTGFSSVKNSVNEGLQALYDNQGVVYTAYIKNFDAVTDFGFEQSETSFDSPNLNADAVTTLSAQYYRITDNFGKFVCTMSNTATCGTTLYVRAFAKVQTAKACGGSTSTNDTILYSNMTVNVPGFEIEVARVENTNTLKATFPKPAIAQDVFNVKKNNVVWTYRETQNATEETVVGTGLSIEATQPGYYRATASLRDCHNSDDIQVDTIIE